MILRNLLLRPRRDPTLLGGTMRSHLTAPQERSIILSDARRILLQLGPDLRYCVLEVLLFVRS